VLGLVQLGAIAIAAALGETIKRLGQLWGANNKRSWSISPPTSANLRYPNKGSKSLTETTNYYVRPGSYIVTAYQGNSWVQTLMPKQISYAAGYGGWAPNAYPEFDIQHGDYRIWSLVDGARNPNAFDFVTLETSPGWGYPVVEVNIILEGVPQGTGPTGPVIGNPGEVSGSDPAFLLPQTIPGPLQMMRLPPVAAVAAEAQAAPVAKVAATPADPVTVVPAVAAAGGLVAVADLLRSLPVIRNTYYSPVLPAADQLRKTTTAGALAPVAVAEVPTTATDARKYGSRTVTAQGARPDLAAIAEEVGRIEQKVGELLGGMDSTPDWLDALIAQMRSALVQAVLDALVVDVPATSYDFVAPCDKNENGAPVEWSAAIEAADYQPAMVARLDAIAEAMGILKGWKQPLCRATPPRSNVTVTAYEYDPEA